ncbi:hypothetical protein J3F84DRAFT_263101 [Trichoderma pleuroticola]
MQPHQILTCFLDKDGYYLADGVLTKEGLLPGAVDPAEAEKLWRISGALTKQAA